MIQPIQLNTEFFAYMHQLEQDVISHTDYWRWQGVSKRVCKLSKQKFGQLIGTSITSDTNCVIDYFGLLKKSTKFAAIATTSEGSIIHTNLLHFQSLKIETIYNINPELVPYFPIFKGTLLSIRGFTPAPGKNPYKCT